MWKTTSRSHCKGYGLTKHAAQLAQHLFFQTVTWNGRRSYKAFYSEGILGLSNILKFDINGGFEGFMEVRKKWRWKSGIFMFFWKPLLKSWYYSVTEDNRLMIQSSNAPSMIWFLKRQCSKAKVGELVFIPGSDEETLAFINRLPQELL